MTYSATNTKGAAVRPCPAKDLQQLESKFFIEACDVKDLQGDEAQQVVAECLAGSGLELEPERLACDRAVNASKATPAYFASSDHFALEQQQHRGGGL